VPGLAGSMSRVPVGMISMAARQSGRGGGGPVVGSRTNVSASDREDIRGFININISPTSTLTFDM